MVSKNGACEETVQKLFLLPVTCTGQPFTENTLVLKMIPEFRNIFPAARYTTWYFTEFVKFYIKITCEV